MTGAGVLVFGGSGQLARELARVLPGAPCLGRALCDLARPGAAAAAIAAHRPEVVINAAAFTDVDAAESAEEAAMALNARAPGEMARACAAGGIPFLHVSTDYVFDGRGTRAWTPQDTPRPLNAYGRSKLAGEREVLAAGGRGLVLRTSWVFSAHGRNFLRTMLGLAAGHDRLRVVGDQTGGPTPADALAGALMAMARQLAARAAGGGIYHLAGAPAVSWAGFAREIFARAGRPVAIDEITTADWPTPARRPLNSRLDCTAVQRDFGLAPPDWRAGVVRALARLETA